MDALNRARLVLPSNIALASDPPHVCPAFLLVSNGLPHLLAAYFCLAHAFCVVSVCPGRWVRQEQPKAVANETCLLHESNKVQDLTGNPAASAPTLHPVPRPSQQRRAVALLAVFFASGLLHEFLVQAQSLASFIDWKQTIFFTAQVGPRSGAGNRLPA